MSEIHRCRICNCVNDPEIATFSGDYKRRISFYADPLYEHSEVCSNCYTPEEDQEDDEILDLLWMDSPTIPHDRKPDNDNE